MSRKKIIESEKNFTDTGKRIKYFESSIGLKPTQICKKLGIRDSYWSDIKYGKVKKGNYEFWQSISKEFPEWFEYIRGFAKNPPQAVPSPPGCEQIDNAMGSIKEPSAPYEPRPQKEPSLDDKEYVRMFYEILLSNNYPMIHTIKNIVYQCYHAMKDSSRINEINGELKFLRNEVSRLKNTVDSYVPVPASQRVKEK